MPRKLQPKHAELLAQIRDQGRLVLSLDDHEIAELKRVAYRRNRFYGERDGLLYSITRKNGQWIGSVRPYQPYTDWFEFKQAIAAAPPNQWVEVAVPDTVDVQYAAETAWNLQRRLGCKIKTRRTPYNQLFIYRETQ